MFNINLKLSLCRTCLTTLNKNNAFNIFNTTDLVKKLILCSALPVEISDEYPENVCLQCYEQITRFYEFQQMCSKSLDKYNELLNSKKAKTEHLEQRNVKVEGICEANCLLNGDDNNLVIIKEKLCEPIDCINDSSLKLLEKKKRGRPPKKKLRNDIERGKFSTVEGIAKAGNTKDISDNQLKKEDEIAKNCSKTCASKKNNYKNISTLSSTDEITSIELNEINKSKINDKTITDFENDYFPTTVYSNFQRHFYSCDRYNKHLKEHKIEQGTDYKCDLESCQRSYKNKSALNVHKRKYHHEGPELKTHMCEVCGKVFKSSAVLTDHRYTHYDKMQLPYACQEEGCTKRFSNKEKLKIHKMRHAGIKNFICPYCGMRKTTRNELKIHINYHTLERTWSCRFCPKVCNSAGNLKTHVKNMHERAKEFACRFCERTFAKADTKKYHEMTHTGEKPHECKECGRRFLQPAALRTHRKIHLRQIGELKGKQIRNVVDEQTKQLANSVIEGAEESLVMEDVMTEIFSDGNDNLKYKL